MDTKNMEIDTDELKLFIVENNTRYKMGYSDMSELDMVLVPYELCYGLVGSEMETVYQDTDNHVYSVSMKEVVQFYIANNEKFKSKRYTIREITNA